MLKKIRVTDLDQIVWFHKIESMTTDDLIKRLLRLDPPNEKMFLGTYWHLVLERKNVVDSISFDNFTFNVTCDHEIIIPKVQEIRARKEYNIDGHKVFLSGKCDGISGNKIIDHKLTFRPNPESYFESYQWRSYLDIFDADIFEYYIYSAKQKNSEINIYDVSKMSMCRYPGMEEDILTGIRNFIDFVDSNCPEYWR